VAYFTNTLFLVLAHIDPFAFIAPICLALGACFITLLRELEENRTRWRQVRGNRVCFGAQEQHDVLCLFEPPDS
jgi:hypothetical protein